MCKIRWVLRRGWKLKSTGGGCVRLNLASLTPTRQLPTSTDPSPASWKAVQSGTSLGGGDGQEVLPVLHRAKQVTVIDASGLPLHTVLAKWGAETREPAKDGSIADPDGAFDLITCFGVLTFLPDPVASFAEFRRCLAPGGWLLLREPIVAMNLEQPEHAGLGRYGRGIPLALLDDLVQQGFTICYRALCTVALTRFIGSNPFNNPRAIRIDAALARLFAWNVHYRATKQWHHLRPKAAAYVLRRH